MTHPKLRPKIQFYASGKPINWALDVTSFPKLRYLCITALELNGEIAVCATPYWVSKNVRLRVRDRKKKGPLHPTQEAVPARIHKYMQDFVRVMMVGEAWGK